MITPDHMKLSKKRTGKDYREIHCWLDMCECNLETDAFINLESYPWQHRIERHTKKGLEHIKKKWGKAAYEEAKKHFEEDGIEI